LVADTTGLDLLAQACIVIVIASGLQRKEFSGRILNKSTIPPFWSGFCIFCAVAGQACTGVVDALGLQGAASNLAGAAVVNICK
jgi:hypothetical protein